MSTAPELGKGEDTWWLLHWRSVFKVERAHAVWTSLYADYRETKAKLTGNIVDKAETAAIETRLKELVDDIGIAESQCRYHIKMLKHLWGKPVYDLTGDPLTVSQISV